MRQHWYDSVWRFVVAVVVANVATFALIAALMTLAARG